MITKTQKAIDYFDAGNYQKAFSIVKTFRNGLTKEQKKTFQLAYEAFVHPDFYKQLNKDPEALKADGIKLFKDIYKKGSK